MTIKLALLKSGEDVIADWREIVLEDGDKVAAYLACYPYSVKIKDGEDASKLGLSYYPWMPLSKDTEIAVDPTWVVTLVDPVDEVKTTYEEKVNVIKERRNGNSPNNRDNTDSDN